MSYKLSKERFHVCLCSHQETEAKLKSVKTLDYFFIQMFDESLRILGKNFQNSWTAALPVIVAFK